MPSRRSSASTDWNNRSWGKPPAGLSGGSSTTASGSRRARSGERSTSWRAAGVRTSLRSAWVSGANGSGSPATGTHDPANKPGFSRDTSSLTSLVLPTPVSPDTTTTPGVPSAARRKAARSTGRLSARPASGPGVRSTT